MWCQGRAPRPPPPRLLDTGSSVTRLPAYPHPRTHLDRRRFDRLRSGGRVLTIFSVSLGAGVGVGPFSGSEGALPTTPVARGVPASAQGGTWGCQNSPQTQAWEWRPPSRPPPLPPWLPRGQRLGHRGTLRPTRGEAPPKDLAATFISFRDEKYPPFPIFPTFFDIRCAVFF